jgi:hypothetical protein
VHLYRSSELRIERWNLARSRQFIVKSAQIAIVDVEMMSLWEGDRASKRLETPTLRRSTLSDRGKVVRGDG